VTDQTRVPEVARSIAADVTGRDPGPMSLVGSLSLAVYVGTDVVVKIIEAHRHTRLDRETGLAASLPPGVTATLLGSGRRKLPDGDVRYACYTRMPGTSPGMGLPDVDAATARRLTETAVERLTTLHQWVPPSRASDILREPLDHGGFTARDDLLALTEDLARLAVPRPIIDGLHEIAQRAPEHAGLAVPVHADCHWGNWLADDGRVTALLDFEWARFGEPADDWFFQAGLAGSVRDIVLDVIARATDTPIADLRDACELRHAAHIAGDLRLALTHPEPPAPFIAARTQALESVVVGHTWRRSAG